MELTITKIVTVTNGAEAYFSPDGKYISFTSSKDNEKDDRSLKLYVMNVSSLNLGTQE